MQQWQNHNGGSFLVQKMLVFLIILVSDGVLSHQQHQHHHHKHRRLVHLQGSFFPDFSMPTDRVLLTATNYSTTVKLNCLAELDSVISWHRLDKGGPIDYTITQETLPEGQLRSTLHVRHFGQRVEFVCTTTRKNGRVGSRRKFVLDVVIGKEKGVPPRFEPEDNGFFRGSNRSLVRFSCKVRGQPLPQLRWILHNDAGRGQLGILASRVETEAGLIVSLNLELRVIREGQYFATCQAENPCGSKRRRFKYIHAARDDA